jgi:hypothetical protein
MKSFLIIISIVFSTASYCQQQPLMNIADYPVKRGVETLSKELNLSTSQTQQLEEIQIATMRDLKSIQQANSKTEEKVKKTKQVLDERERKLKQLFSAEQHAKYSEMKNAAKAKAEANRKNVVPKPNPK